MSYLLDANVFIQAKNLHYGMDFCPAFWEWLVAENQAHKIFSIDKVAEEIKSGEDELTDWVHKLEGSMFLKTDAVTAQHFSSVNSWVMNQGYESSAIHVFLQVADFYLIAHALVGPYIVVTHEIPSNSIRKIKIPDVCIGLGLRFMSPYEMLRREKAKFVLRPSP
ncbi:MAG: DUF4411 family protein [Candidatus Cloacimonetes bacterium]|nr:DUF4411 family protein [Candidatus Cloacimonadota bacterium]